MEAHFKLFSFGKYQKKKKISGRDSHLQNLVSKLKNFFVPQTVTFIKNYWHKFIYIYQLVKH